MNDTLTLLAAGLLLGGWGVFIFALASRGGQTLYDPDDYGSLCVPSRHANITANTAQPARHILAELAPPAGWRDVVIVAAPAAARQPGYMEQADGSLDLQEEWDGDDYDELDDLDPEPFPVAVPNWPKLKPVEQPAVVEPEPVPVVVNRTAAGFANLELRGGK